MNVLVHETSTTSRLLPRLRRLLGRHYDVQPVSSQTILALPHWRSNCALIAIRHDITLPMDVTRQLTCFLKENGGCALLLGDGVRLIDKEMHGAPRCAMLTDFDDNDDALGSILRDRFGMRASLHDGDDGTCRPSTYHMITMDRAHATRLNDSFRQLARAHPLECVDKSPAPVLAAWSDTDTAFIVATDHMPASYDGMNSCIRMLPAKCMEDVVDSSVDSPQFDAQAYYAHMRRIAPGGVGLGSTLLYADVVASTQTLLANNIRLLATLPHGLVHVATQQYAGRGRGQNQWISPTGSLLFSTVLHYDLSICGMQRMLFVQYIMALAMVKAVRAELHARFPIYIKWPNDVYVDMSGDMDDERGSESISDMRFRFVDKLKRGCMTKIGGILVNSSFGSGGMDMGTCTLVVGCGLNANNDAPTVALKHLATKLQLDTSALTMERLLARVSVEFSNVYGRLLAGGFDACADEYYRYWIHQNQPVLIRDDCETSLNHRGIEDEKDGAKTTRARITGVTAEGNLRAVDADGCVIELMPGGNSFQLAEGMISRRIA